MNSPYSTLLVVLSAGMLSSGAMAQMKVLQKPSRPQVGQQSAFARPLQHGHLRTRSAHNMEFRGGVFCVAGADGTGLGLDERIINVTMSNINNNSADATPVAPSYVDYTSVVGNVQTGQSYPISVGVSSAIAQGYNTDQVLAWVDFNQDQDFDDVGEQVFVSVIAAQAAYTGVIAIPGGAALGSTRMRIRLHDTHDGSSYINNFNDTPCGTASYGEVEDYTLNITTGGGSTPVNDDCTGAVAQSLSVGNTVTFSGDNTGATEDGGTGFIIVWEAFTISTCANVDIGYCSPGFVFDDFLLNLSVNCPDFLTGLLEAPPTIDNCTVSFAELPAGTYYIPVMVDPAVTPVGAYIVTATATPCGGGTGPVNDDCAGVVPAALSVGGSVDFVGDNTGATVGGDIVPGSGLDAGGDTTTVWHAFTITECATITVAYCGTITLPAVYWATLSLNCPADDDLIFFDAGNFDDCADGNATIVFSEVPAGTYYLPVRGEPATEGPYSIEVSATACATAGPYCDAGADGTGLGLEERIVNVLFAGIDNDSPDASPINPAYQDFTAIVGSVVGGLTYPIGIDVARNGSPTSYSENQVIVWIDFNQDEDFDDAGELVFTSAIGSVDVYTGDIVIPGSASQGTTRMRIRLHDTHDGSAYENNFNDTPCGLASYGEVEDYTIDVIGVITGVAESAAPAFTVFPNPSSGDVNFTYAGSDAVTVVSVLDMTGRVVISEQRQLSNGQMVHLSLSESLAAGTYALRLSSEFGRGEQRFIVR